MAQHFKDKYKVTPIGITTPLVDFIPDSEGLISYQARVSSPNNQQNFETADKLLAYCARHGQWSIFDMSNLVLEITAPRDISRQVLRHSSAKFQEFCVAEGTKIHTMTASGSLNKVAIEDLYKRYNSDQYWGMSSKLVRVYDEKSGKFISAKIKEVFDTGVKSVYKMTLDNGKTITSTKDHKFLTRFGFKRLEDIDVGDFIGCNGDVCYQNYDWMKKSKEESLRCGGGVQYIADKADVSYHTIRKLLKILNLKFTKKEVASYTEIWNKGLPKELQPNFGKFHSSEVREKQRNSSRRGENSEFYKHGNGKTWRKSVNIWSRGYKSELFTKQGGVCAISGKPLDLNNCDVDHVKPVFKYPELAFDPLNLRLISKEEHLKKSTKEMTESRIVPRYSPVKSIEYVGEMKTYDLEVDHESHNYVADGIVTHNSQRYADVTDDMFCLRDLRAQDDKNRQNSISGVFSDDDIDEWYKDQQEVIDLVQSKVKKWRSKDAAKECTRVFMPEGLTMSNMYMNGTVRTWIHYSGLRGKRGETQDEHCDVADACKQFLLKYFPSLSKVLSEQK